jgi:CheY-like chemotaxis protein
MAAQLLFLTPLRCRKCRLRFYRFVEAPGRPAWKRGRNRRDGKLPLGLTERFRDSQRNSALLSSTQLQATQLQSKGHVQIDAALQREEALPDNLPKGSAADHSRGRRSILFLDDDPAMRKFFTRLLTREGYAVREASDSGSAVAELRDAKTDLAVVNLGACEEQEPAVRALRSACPELPIILLSQSADLADGSETLLILPRPSHASTLVTLIGDVALRNLSDSVSRSDAASRAPQIPPQVLPLIH